MTLWDFQNKGKSRWTGKSSFVLEVPLCHLRPSVIYSVPCDWILQRACCRRVLSLSVWNSYDNLFKSPSRNHSLFRREKDEVLVNLRMRTGFNRKTYNFESVDADVSLFRLLFNK